MNPAVPPEQIALSASTIRALAGCLELPTYDRGQLAKGIVHIGAGGFNRSHLAVYLDDLLQSGGDPRWGECGIGLLAPDQRLHKSLKRQDYLYGLLASGSSGTNLRIIGSLVEHLYAPQQTEAVLERMSNPACSIVSLTVTEGGYFIADGSQRLLDTDPQLRHDLEFPSRPNTFLGYLAEAADRRQKSGAAPFSVLSCDNLQGNGNTARAALLAFAELRDPALRRWIESNVSFPNSMVDRITPGTKDEHRGYIAREFAVLDACPVVCEPFRQFVLEDNFSTGRPAWERAGVMFTTNVAAFERVKMRLLNGGHSSIAYLAALLGIGFVDEAIADPQIREVLVRFLDEAAQILDSLPGMELDAYKQTIIERFANPFIHDQIGRIASEGTAKLAKFIVPSINELIAKRYPPRYLPLAVAAWLHAMEGKDEAGRPLSIIDSYGANLTKLLCSRDYDIRDALTSIPGFESLTIHGEIVVGQIRSYLHAFRTSGVRATLTAALMTQGTSRR